ncbi:hypothetical protein [Oleiharenicola lentus]|uniref:hypothetical protein n=1 Tax=Oleiharenicola lentus TaxID=2508720 RepID=UPI003F66148F
MLGFEYTWLLSFTRTSNGDLHIRRAGSGLTTLAVVIFCLLAVVLSAEPVRSGLLREAATARNVTILSSTL